MLIVVYEVVLRYAFNNPTAWADELAQYIFATMWVLAGGYVLKSKSMVNMDMFYGKLTARKKAIADVATAVFPLTFAGALFWQSAKVGLDSLKWHEVSGTVWNVPLYPIRIALALGTLLLVFQLISELIKNIRLIRSSEK
jgi:TRAP-type mannitol/chloroaromatic compound transport system permease small subunit